MPATQPFLVYRDRIGVSSEIAFLRRQYIGFTRLYPVWTGRTLLPDAPQIGRHLHRLGGDGLFGPVRRFMFRQVGRAPPVCLPDAAAILHAQFARGGALALPLARRRGLRMAVTLHGGDVSKQSNWHYTILAQRWPAVVRETARFICVSAAVAEIAAARGVPRQKLTILPIGVEIPEHQPARPAGPAGHLFVGRLVEKKGIGVLAEAMRRLRAEGDQTPLICVGDGPLRAVLQALSRDIAGVTLTGWLPAEAVRARMADAVSLIVPSIIAGDGDTEGLPSVIAEAMAQACPVIGSDQGGIAEAIHHEQTGLLVAPGEPVGLAAAMHRIASTAGLATTLGLAGYRYAATELNARRQSAKLEDLLLAL